MHRADTVARETPLPTPGSDPAGPPMPGRVATPGALRALVLLLAVGVAALTWGPIDAGPDWSPLRVLLGVAAGLLVVAWGLIPRGARR